MTIRLILNGKVGDQPKLRKFVSRLRKQGVVIDVRLTWEGRDIGDFIHQASANNITHIIVGGGDGSLYGAVNALMKLPVQARPSLGIIPLGSANDFAKAALIPMEPTEAFAFAVRGQAHFIDLGKMNEHYFINAVTAGFGASVTANTPHFLKRILGGGAYSLMGAVQIMRFNPYFVEITTPNQTWPSSLLVMAVGNGRQAGGAQELTPQAHVNDGLLDVMLIKALRFRDLSRVIKELDSLSEENELVRYFKTPWLELTSKQKVPISLDGEMHEINQARFEIVPNALKVVLPNNSPLLQAQSLRE